MNYFLSLIAFPFNYLRICLRWRKSRKRGGGLLLHVHDFSSFSRLLNRKNIHFVVLRKNFQPEDIYRKDYAGDFDLLAHEVDLKQILWHSALITGRISVDVYFDTLPCVNGYHYYPPHLAEKILSNSILENTIPVIRQPYYFHSFLYHTLYQKGIQSDGNLSTKHMQALKKMTSNHEIVFDEEWSLLGFSNFLQKNRFAMPFDLLKKWPYQHRGLDLIYEHELQKLQKIDPSPTSLIWVIREDSIEKNIEARLIELIGRELDIVDSHPLSHRQVNSLTELTRGGNWIERSKKNGAFLVKPAHIIVCRFDSFEKFSRYCSEELAEFKRKVRQIINNEFKRPDLKQRYVVHTGDDPWESLQYALILKQAFKTENAPPDMASNLYASGTSV